MEAIGNNLRMLSLKKDNMDSTSEGQLFKKIEEENGSLYLYKAGQLYKKRFSNTEAVIEELCYKIAEYMKINCASYEIVEKQLEMNRDWVTQKILVSKSPWFIGEGQTVVYAKYLIPKYLLSKKEAYYHITNTYPYLKKDIDNMIIFDFLVNNIDRHYKNFGVIREGNNISFAPLYDHGSCLTGDIDDEFCRDILDKEIEDLSLEQYLEDCDISKPFSKNHYSEIRLVENTDLLRNKHLDDILDIVDKVCGKYFIEERITIIKEILKERFIYLCRRFNNGDF